ncbi:hypothetical protein [Planctobacterium marinum]|uniref:Uncharacterized protein n=1 Tax=Planctobacterium marinum TaxID=1631968 RepID=A0AA48KPT5_9ALTE|nr:hypothetical protein MACH26_25120 [Planctobacterium marinum]
MPVKLQEKTQRLRAGALLHIWCEGFGDKGLKIKFSWFAMGTTEAGKIKLLYSAAIGISVKCGNLIVITRRKNR